MEQPKTKVLTTPLIAAIIVIVILLGALGWAAVQLTAPPPATVEYPVGLAIAVTGTAYSQEGPIRRNGATLAIEQMNADLAAIGSPVRFRGVHEDTTGTAAGADGVLRNFAAAGIKVVVGPLSSGETSAVRDFVTTNKIVVISPSATAISLAIPNDYVFRAAPTDLLQAKALAQLVNRLGYTDVAIIARQDDYGVGLSDLFENRFTTVYGGRVLKTLYATSATDLSAEVTALEADVTDLGVTSTTAVLVIAFSGDAFEIFDEARTRATLGQVRWFGSESLRRGVFIDNATSVDVRQFIDQVNLTGFFPSPADNPVNIKFEADYIARFGQDPSNSPYSYYAYDSAWMAMMAVLTAGRYDGEAIAKALPIVAERYFGASGYKQMDANGDAVGADYRVWQQTFSTALSKHVFIEIGVWRFPSEELELYP